MDAFNPKFAERKIENRIRRDYSPAFDSFSPLNYQARRTYDIPLIDDDSFAASSPNLYAVTGMMYKTLAIDMLPPVKYAYKEDREAFMRLKKKDQRYAILWDTLGTMLSATGFGKYAGAKGLVGQKTLGLATPGYQTGSKVMQRIKGAWYGSPEKLRPVEDWTKFITDRKGYWESFSHDAAIIKELGKKGFGSKEIPIIQNILKTDAGLPTSIGKGASIRDFGNVAGKSNAFKQNISKQTGFTPQAKYFEKLKLNPQLADELSYESLSAKHWGNLYKKNLEDLYGKGAPGMNYIDETIQHQAAKYYPLDELKNFSLGTLDDVHAANFIADMIRHPHGVKKVLGPDTMSMIQPQRWLWGQGEAIFNVNSKIYQPIIQANMNSRKYVVEQSTKWLTMLEQRGFGTLNQKKLKDGIISFKPDKKLYNAETLSDANNILTKMDNLYEGLRKAEAKGLTPNIDSLKNEIFSLNKYLKNSGEAKAHLVNMYRDFHNSLYGDYFRMKIPQIFRKHKVTDYAARQIDSAIAKLNSKIDETFQTSMNKADVSRADFVESTLKSLRDNIKKDPHTLFGTLGAKQMQKKIDGLLKDLTTGHGGNFPAFLEGYAARLSTTSNSIKKQIDNMLSGDYKPFFTKTREALKADDILDLPGRIEARLSAQAKDLFLYPQLQRSASYAQKLPDAWKKQTDYLYGRLLNRPSQYDERVADLLNNTYGRAVTALTKGAKRPTFDAESIMGISRKIVDFQHMGFLGAKPFSAARNLMQPLITGLADVGSAMDLVTLGRGYKRILDPSVRKELRGMGIITDYVPELSQKALIPKGAKLFAKGKISLPTKDNIQEYAMWMFQGSDKINRYAMGGTAMVKWDQAVKKFGIPTRDNIGKFGNKLGLQKRNAWVKQEIEDLILKGNAKKAREVFIKDIVADTQFLYGALDAPTLVGAGGGVGKTAMAFQSWWMNYGSLLGKWFKTGQGPGGKVENMFNWMFASAVAEISLSQLYGHKAAAGQVAFGPLPTGLNPPAFRVIGDSLMSIKELGQLPFDRDFEGAQKQLIRTLKNGFNFVPMGNQISTTVGQFRKEGTEEGLLSILGMHRRDQ